MLRNLARLGRYRGLIHSLVARELKARYRGSVLGFFWSFFNPLLLLLVYSFVFTYVMTGAHDKRTEPYALFMFCGLLPWTWFSSSLIEASGVLISGGNLIKKVLFPAEILPAHIVLVGLFNSVVGFALLAAGVYVLQGELPHHLWMFPAFLLFQAFFTLGFGYLCAAGTVFIRDLLQLLPMALNFWFFLTPIFFISRFPAQDDLMKAVHRWNPVSYLIEGYRELFVLHPGDMRQALAELPPEALSRIAVGGATASGPPWSQLWIFGSIAVLMLLAGHAVFIRLKPGFADEV